MSEQDVSKMTRMLGKRALEIEMEEHLGERRLPQHHRRSEKHPSVTEEEACMESDRFANEIIIIHQSVRGRAHWEETLFDYLGRNLPDHRPTRVEFRNSVIRKSNRKIFPNDNFSV